MARNEMKGWSGPYGKGPGWICDTCGEIINTAGEGWLEWLDASAPSGGITVHRKIHLVHHALSSPAAELDGNCYFDEDREFRFDGSTPAGHHLDTFLGSDGLTKLLALLGDGFEPRDKLLEIIMRLHVENYEEARQFVKCAIADGVIEPNMRPGFYLQESLLNVIKQYAPERERGWA